MFLQNKAYKMIILNSLSLMTMKPLELSWKWYKMRMKRTRASSWIRYFQTCCCYLAEGICILFCLFTSVVIQESVEINWVILSTPLSFIKYHSRKWSPACLFVSLVLGLFVGWGRDFLEVFLLCVGFVIIFFPQALSLLKHLESYQRISPPVDLEHQYVLEHGIPLPPAAQTRLPFHLLFFRTAQCFWNIICMFNLFFFKARYLHNSPSLL